MKAKGIIKEVTIIGLVTLAIVLILAILLYGYSPSGKIVPNKVEYSTPEDVKEEIMAADVDSSTPVKVTYELDETQITNSKKSGSYTSGKQNPFAKAQTEQGTEEENKDSSSGNTTNEGNSKNASSENTSSSDGKNSTSEKQYLPSTGTK